MTSYTPHKTIVLIGLMGAGKTTIGRRLARKLGLRFRDSDDEISAAAGCTIPDIFEIHGEAIFRDLELRVLDRLMSESEPYVLATGGGAWMTEAVRNLIKEKGVSVWLKADLEVLLDRVSRKNNRPLLERGDKRSILEKLMHDRYPVYAGADITIESDDGAHETVVDSVIDAIKKHMKD
jgi:shikimate kinase